MRVEFSDQFCTPSENYPSGMTVNFNVNNKVWVTKGFRKSSNRLYDTS